ncbi:MAG: sugar phosphate isomerase/epimerase [Chitinophagaceae bacterium]|nr:sugar phosphate isomerase/epimerase [Chitinophagaceae bacterium]
MKNRRSFLQLSALGIAGAVAKPSFALGSFEAPTTFPLGFAGYSFARFDIDKMIAMLQKLNVKNLSLKEIHLPLNSSNEAIEAAKKKFADGGINVYTVGVIYMRSKEAVDQAFEYARKVGVEMIVGVPNQDLLSYAEAKVKETNIRLAIHNHGPEDKLYPSPKDIYDRIKNFDPRVGLCIDIGHTLRAGVLPEKTVKEYRDRLFDLHLKDVTAMAKDAKVIEIGRGAINYPAFMEAFKKVNYKGVCSVEYEKDMTDPLVGMAESVGFVKGIMRA